MGTLSVDKLVKTSQGAAEFTLPATDGTAGQVWQTDGAGQLSVAALAADTVGTSQISALAVDTAEIAANAVDGSKIAMGSDSAGDVLYYNGTDYVRLGAGTASQTLKMNSGATAPEWVTVASTALQSKVGEFNYYVNTASGTQAITGVGFQPTALWIFAGPDRGITPPPVFGGTDGTTMGNVASIHATAANLWDANTSFLIDVEISAGNTATAVLTTFDADGFTLTWTKTGSPPSQVILINYWAVR